MPYVNVNGLDVFYYDDDFTDPWKPKDTILINHYGAGDSTLYNRWALALAKHYRVIRWDRPGYGKSEVPGFPYVMTPERFVSDIVAFLDAIGVEKVHWVSDKAASAAGVVFASMHPERVQSMSLAVCLLSGRRVREVFHAQADDVIARGSWVAAFDSGKGGKDLGEGTDSLEDAYYRTVRARTPAHVLAAALRCVADPAYDIEPILETVRTPTLLLAPDIDDFLTTKEEQEIMVARMPSCERRVLPGSTVHFPFTDPDWTVEQILDFLGTHATHTA